MSEKGYKIAIGIDPGKDGAMAILTPKGEDYHNLHIDGGYATIVPFDEGSYMNELALVEDHVSAMWRCEGVVCVLERVGGIPGQSAPASFAFGDNFGFIRGLLTVYKIPFELVTPGKWKKEFSCTSDKNTSIAVAQRLFPDLDLRKNDKCRKPHDGICEALLMAEYARRHMA